ESERERERERKREREREKRECETRRDRVSGTVCTPGGIKPLNYSGSRAIALGNAGKQGAGRELAERQNKRESKGSKRWTEREMERERERRREKERESSSQCNLISCHGNTHVGRLG